MKLIDLVESEITKLQRRYSNPRTLRTRDNLEKLSSRLQNVDILSIMHALPDYQAPSFHSPNGDLYRKTAEQGRRSSTSGSNGQFLSMTQTLRVLFNHRRKEFVILGCWLFILYRHLTLDLEFVIVGIQAGTHSVL
jgi:hypothetical protein